MLHAPGHAPGHLALFEERTGVLIAQYVLYDGPLVTDCPGADRRASIASVCHLLELAPRIVHGGHFASFGPVRLRQLVDAFLAEVDRRGRGPREGPRVASARSAGAASGSTSTVAAAGTVPGRG